MIGINLSDPCIVMVHELALPHLTRDRLVPCNNSTEFLSSRPKSLLTAVAKGLAIQGISMAMHSKLVLIILLLYVQSLHTDKQCIPKTCLLLSVLCFESKLTLI